MEINWSDGYAGEKGDWFKNIKIPLNSGLVSVIGNKGNGKSAIAEIIGWLSDSKNYTKFAFLNSKKFLKNRLANNFTAKITWIDNQVSMKENLGAQPDLNNVERVQCIPQQYFEEICTDTELEKFTTEINGVIFSRLSEEDKEGARSFEELIDKYTRISEQNISLMQTNLSEVNRDIISLESKLSREYKTKQEALLQDAQNQLLAQINICPQEVKKPELPQEVQEQYDKVIEEIGNIENEIEKKQEEILEVNSVSKKVQHILQHFDYPNYLQVGLSLKVYLANPTTDKKLVTVHLSLLVTTFPVSYYHLLIHIYFGYTVDQINNYKIPTIYCPLTEMKLYFHCHNPSFF